MLSRRADAQTIVNLPLFRLMGLYQMLNVDRSKGQRLNTVGTSVVVAIAIMMAVNAISVFQRLFLTTDDRGQLYQQMLFYTNSTISAYKLLVIVHQARVISEFFDTAHEKFLTATPCRVHGPPLLSRCRVQSTTLTAYYSRMFAITGAMWMALPLTFVHRWTASERHPNTLNLDYPWIGVHAYNRYFAAFYAVEAAMAALTSYGIVVFDVFLMSFCWAISSQYDTVNTAFRRLNDSGNESDQNYYYNTLKSIILDNNHIYEKLQKFYDVIRPVVLIQVAVSSCSVVLLNILIVLNYKFRTSPTTIEDSKYVTTLLSLAVELFIYCSLVENLNNKKELVNFSLYSCDWTRLDLRTKKLLLFAMKMNNSNSMKIKMTQNKIINRALFISVMHTSYSVISVLLNTKINQNEKQ